MTSYQLLLETLVDGVFVAQDYRFVFCNPALPAMLGYTSDEFVGIHFNQIVAPQYLEMWTERYDQRVGSVKEPENCYEVQFLCKDGKAIWVELRANRSEFKNRPAVQGIIRDITERKHTEEKLRLWGDSFEKVEFGLAMADAKTNKFIYVNPTFARERGYSREELVGKPIMTIFPADIADQVRTKISELDTLSHIKFESVHLCKDGRKFPVLLDITTIKSEDGTPLRRIAYAMDISERKCAEAALLESNYLLRESQRIAHVGSWRRDLNTGSHAWSDETYRIYGRSPENFVPNIESLLKVIHPDDRMSMQMWLTDCAQGKRPKQIEFKIILPNGSIRILSGYGELQYDNDMKPSHILGMVLDITDRKLTEENLRKSHLQSKIFIQVAPISIAMFDKDMNYLAASNRWVAEYGRGYTDLVGRNHYDLHPDLPDEWKMAHKSGLKGQAISHSEDKWIQSDGSEHWLRWALVPWDDTEGNIGGIIISAEDITERKLAEREIRVTATTFDTQEGILISDANNSILRVNRVFTEITGYEASEVIGKNPRILSSGRQDKNFYTKMWESINGTGFWSGEVWNKKKNGEIYPESLTVTAVMDEQGTLTNYVATMSDISRRKNDEMQIENLAFYDSLTKLPNRRLLIERMKQALASSTRSGKAGALLFIDLDNFKNLNDSLGHDTGDLLLQQVSERLGSCIRENDTVARFGGDEFVVLLNELSEQMLEAATQAESIGNQILTSLNMPYELATHPYHCTPSIGITLFKDHEHEIEDLLKQADLAMYQAKKAGRNILRFFDPKMQESINQRTAIERELRLALEKKQFRLYYQIQVDSDGHAFGAEALIRWIHPDRGLVSPLQFIPVAEETGLILPIGQWVFEAACSQIKAWEQNERTCELVLSVNVSARQFRQSDFVAQTLATMRRFAINPSKLKLELTESILLDSVEDVISTMKALHEEGVQFSLDDFGTGYSSLQYLKKLPLNQLKIDQSFVRDITFDEQDRSIVRTIIAMAHSLDLEVIAEGVEMEEQKQRLMNKGCRHFQGYLFSKPLPLDEFERLLNQGY